MSLEVHKKTIFNMKKKLLLSLSTMLLLLLPVNGFTSQVQTKEQTVFICTGGKSKKFHATPKCRGLNRCSGRIIEITIEKAESKGRTPCRICY